MTHSRCLVNISWKWNVGHLVSWLIEAIISFIECPAHSWCSRIVVVILCVWFALSGFQDRRYFSCRRMDFFVYYSQLFIRVRLDMKSVALALSQVHWPPPPLHRVVLMHHLGLISNLLWPTMPSSWELHRARGDGPYGCVSGRAVALPCQVCIEDKHNFLRGWQGAVEGKEPHLWKTLFLAALWNELLQKHLLLWRPIIFKVTLLIGL